MGQTAEQLLTGLLQQAGIPLDGSVPYGLQVHDDRVWGQVVKEHNLGLGESYMDGRWDCNRIDELFARVLSTHLEGGLRPSPRLVWLALSSWLSNHQTSIRAHRNAQHHYDIGNDLYRAMLGPEMVYSCGYWRGADTLADAQQAKFDLICRKLGLSPGMTLLDIGCGWGAFLEFAARNYGVRGVGITPASEQVAVARERCQGLPVRIRTLDYRDLGGSFDRIVSIGMMEHVGPRNLKRFFAVCDSVLAPGGRMLHHTIGSNVSTLHGDAFLDRYIFPGGVIPSLKQIAAASADHFVVDDLQDFGPDYDRTLMAWSERIERSWDSLPGYDERFRRMWRYYLLSSAGAFRARAIHLWQFVMSREGPAPRYDAPR